METGFRKTPNPRGAIDHIDAGDERIVCLAVRTPVNNEVYGVSCHVDKQAYRDYANGSASYCLNHDTEYDCHYATEISHLKELATKTADAIDAIGITATHNRFEALADLVQMIPYIDERPNHPATYVLYEGYGDCFTKAGLYSAIVQNDPWDIMPAFIHCYIGGGRHMTIGIDINDLGNDFDAGSAFTVSPFKERVNNFGFTDTEYAFLDMTYDSPIGHRGGTIGEPITLAYEGDFSKRPEGINISNNPPNY